MCRRVIIKQGRVKGREMEKKREGEGGTDGRTDGQTDRCTYSTEAETGKSQEVIRAVRMKAGGDQRTMAPCPVSKGQGQFHRHQGYDPKMPSLPLKLPSPN